MKTWVRLALVFWLAAGCAKTDSAIDEGPGATETNVGRGMCSTDADCPGSRCLVARSPSVRGRCEDADEDDAGAEGRCEVAADCAEGDRCSSRGFCYRVGTGGGGG